MSQTKSKWIVELRMVKHPTCFDQIVKNEKESLCKNLIIMAYCTYCVIRYSTHFKNLSWPNLTKPSLTPVSPFYHPLTLSSPTTYRPWGFDMHRYFWQSNHHLFFNHLHGFFTKWFLTQWEIAVLFDNITF
jgi:hypothetical protein